MSFTGRATRQLRGNFRRAAGWGDPIVVTAGGLAPSADRELSSTFGMSISPAATAVLALSAGQEEIEQATDSE